jgi:hypothetical protein
MDVDIFALVEMSVGGGISVLRLPPGQDGSTYCSEGATARLQL